MNLQLFLFGEDSLDDVRQVRADAIAAFNAGRMVQWTSLNTTVQKAQGIDLAELVSMCNNFLRNYDPVVHANNPIITETIPWLFYS